MHCPHCYTVVHLHFKKYYSVVYVWSTLADERPIEDRGSYTYCYCVYEYRCPACNKMVVLLEKGLGEINDSLEKFSMAKVLSQEILYPKLIARMNFSAVPERLNNDYRQTVSVLNISPKASAALSRRFLQDVLQNHYKIKKRNLEAEIKEFISFKEIPISLAETVDAIRIIGNFAAHLKT